MFEDKLLPVRAIHNLPRSVWAPCLWVRGGRPQSKGNFELLEANQASW